MRILGILLVLFAIHTAPLWFYNDQIAGQYGDPLSHATMAHFYCDRILPGQFFLNDFHSDKFLFPSGVDLSASFESPFPLVLTCPLYSVGGTAQLNLFAALQVALILLTGWLVARKLTAHLGLQLAYILFVWWTGFYFARIYEHYTLLSGIWGFQLLLWSAITVQFSQRKNLALRGLLIGLAFAGSFHNVAMLTFPAVILLLTALSLQWKQTNKKDLILNTVIGVGIASLVFGLLFWPSIVTYLTKVLPKSTDQRSDWNLDILGLVLPWTKSPVYQWLPAIKIWGHEKFNSVDFLMLGSLLFMMTRKSFWSNRMRAAVLFTGVVSLIFAFGPEVRFDNEFWFKNPIEPLINRLPPFSLSRTPGRFATVSVLAITFLVFQYGAPLIRQKQNWLAAGLIIWATLMGPVLNAQPTLPMFALNWLPKEGIDAIRRAPQGTSVLHAPLAISQDQGQGFIQLFHDKPISAGYLSYVTYTEETLQKFTQSAPYALEFNCVGPEPFHLLHPAFGGDLSKLRSTLLAARATFIIVNGPGVMACPDLRNLIGDLTKQPWVKVYDQGAFVVLEIN